MAKWLHGLLTLLLAPLLMYQGKRVRRVTPRLPEAPGERYGEVGTGKPLQLLILGDSAAAGVGIASQRQALSGCLAQALAPHWQVKWQLLAQSSLTTAAITNLLDQIPAQTIDVVLVSCGVNDVTRSTSSTDFAVHLQQLQQRLEQHFKSRLVIYTTLPPMHKFPALPQPLRWFLGAKARRLDQVLQHFVAQQPKARLLALDLPFSRDFMASDGFHPSHKATPLWALAATSIIQHELIPHER
jgi:lysophospholipase L1-like esterase